MSYLGTVWRNAVRRYKSRLAAGRERLMGWIIQTAILFGILYFQPWVGDLQDEAKLAAAGVAAVLGSAFLSFIIDLLMSPKDLHERALWEAGIYREAMGFTASVAKHQEMMIAIYKEGEDIYQGETSYAAWRDGLLQWHERVCDTLKRHYGPTVLFDYEHADGHGVLSKWVEILDEDQPRRGEYNKLFSARLKNLYTVIYVHSFNGARDFPKILAFDAHEITPDHIEALYEEHRRKLAAR